MDLQRFGDSAEILKKFEKYYKLNLNGFKLYFEFISMKDSLIRNISKEDLLSLTMGD